MITLCLYAGVWSLPAIAQLRQLCDKEAVAEGRLKWWCVRVLTKHLSLSCWESCYWTDTTLLQWLAIFLTLRIWSSWWWCSETGQEISSLRHSTCLRCYTNTHTSSTHTQTCTHALSTSSTHTHCTHCPFPPHTHRYLWQILTRQSPFKTFC